MMNDFSEPVELLLLHYKLASRSRPHFLQQFTRDIKAGALLFDFTAFKGTLCVPGNMGCRYTFF